MYNHKCNQQSWFKLELLLSMPSILSFPLRNNASKRDFKPTNLFPSLLNIRYKPKIPTNQKTILVGLGGKILQEWLREGDFENISELLGT